MGVELAIHFGNVAVIRKTEIGVVADDKVLVNSNAHNPAGMNQLLGNLLIFPGWPWLS
jgi:hypothetical protein